MGEREKRERERRSEKGKQRGEKREGIGSNRADGRERNFFGRTAAAEQRTRDIKEEFLEAHVALGIREGQREEKENPQLIQEPGIHATGLLGIFRRKFSPLILSFAKIRFVKYAFLSLV